ncbi:mannosyltransferase [Clostridium polyendosporum]|uniref:Mannosyltransferase n=1 Tax=Clostridium polyendosporum TaxID=69208 RepID=A0A919VHF9_9CLOT|nr:glycosyltransferase family 1 protein [Clostridium polyendosporum]GIM29641.1 mannosyltransferase [Clostridium polyendosporum]
MKIAIDARGINWYKGTGIGTYTYNVLKKLLQFNDNNEYSLFWSGGNFQEFKRRNTNIIMASKKHQRFFESIYFPNYIDCYNVDIYHVPQNGIGISNGLNCKKIVTIHDLIPYILPETVGKGYLKKFLEEMPKIIECSDGIITVSEQSKNDILKFFPCYDKEKIYVTPLAADVQFNPIDKKQCKNTVNERYKFNTPYILYIGGFSARKNVRGLIEAFHKIQKDLKKVISLVIVGSLRDEGEKIYNLVKELNLLDKIIFTGFAEDQFLPTLYSGCEVFVYPSFYEGFGLPPLEAMSCKAPVITSNTTSIPEVVGDAGLLINPHNKDELSCALLKVLNDEDFKENLREKGYLRSQHFSWQNTAINTLMAYQSVNENLTLSPKVVI